MTIDTTAPVAPSIASFSPDTGTVGDGITTANVLTLTGTAEANSTVKVFDGATLIGSAAANGSGAWTYTTAALANGAHSLTATATDAAGNTGAASAALAVTVTAPPGAPTITSFSPDTRRCRRWHHRSCDPDADRHRGGEQHGECVRRDDAARHGDGECQRGLELCHGSLAGRGA